MNIRPTYCLTLFLLAVMLCTSSCNSTPKTENAAAANIKQVLDNVYTYQVNHFTYVPDSVKGNHHDYGIDAWTNGVLYLGISEWAKYTDNDIYYKWLYNIGQTNNWKIPANFRENPRYQLYHADELCVGQFYLNMYDKYKEDKMMNGVKERVDWIMANPPSTDMSYRNKHTWSWCDALFMAPPVYIHLYSITGNKEYLNFMDKYFRLSYDHLYDKENRLFFRDDSYFSKTEANGQKIFWGRGNGWVIAALANILKQLPEQSEIRPFYEELYKELAQRLSELQSKDGFWHASLLDPESYPSPETSATALITYGLAYGVNSGILSTSYLPTIRSAWNALMSVINEEGKVGYVQPIGADPKKVTKEMSAVYGTGAVLMAGIEILNLINTNSL